jgi:hypothetical protein
MESDWDKFVVNLNQCIDDKLGTVEQELNHQDEMIKKLSKSLRGISEALQTRYGKLDLNSVENSYDPKHTRETSDNYGLSSNEYTAEPKENVNLGNE